MSRTQAKPSPTDQHARRIAAAIAKGQRPRLSADLDSYFENSPREIFTAFEGVARHMPPAGSDEALALGYLFLLAGLLEHLRYRSDRGYPDADRLIAEFQAEVTARAEAGQIDGHVLGHLTGALHQAKIPASPELSAALAKEAVGRVESGAFPAEMQAALAGFLDLCKDDPFALVGALAELGHAALSEARAAFAVEIARAGRSDARSAAVLFLLDPDPVVRSAVAGALAGLASSLSPTDVRRLIAVRNWRPEDERNTVDAIVRNARTAGIDCAQWPAGSAETILATAIDGTGTQGFLLISPAGRKKRLSSILTKDDIADAFTGEPQSRRSIEETLAASGLDTPMIAVSRSYLDRMLAHSLALTIEKGNSPPAGLLEVAETLGGADWQPARMDFGDALARLIAEIPEAMREPTSIREVLGESGALADLELIAQSWYEDGPDIAKAAAGTRGKAKLATYLLQSVIARHRDMWARIFLRTALWMREAPAELDLCWRELAIVAKALADGHDVGEIGLMRDIAERTAAVLADKARP